MTASVKALTVKMEIKGALAIVDYYVTWQLTR